MRKNFLWVLVIFFCAIFLSGCGGSLDVPENSSVASNDISPTKNYDIAKILNGNWITIDDPININIQYNQSTDIDLVMASVFMSFSQTKINNNTGTSFVVSNQTWRAFLNENDTRSYIGLVYINLGGEVMSLARADNNKWRGEIYDANRTVLFIEILSSDLISVTQEGIIEEIYNGMGADYSITFTMRKQ